MERPFEQVREFGHANLRPKADLPRFLETISRVSIATVVQWEKRLRLGGETFQFKDVKAARQMCELLSEHFGATGIPVHLSCQD